MVGDLPSSEHAQAFIKDPSGNVVAIGTDVVVRAMIIALGMRMFRGKGLRGAVAGSLGIEAFVLLFTLLSRKGP